MTARRHPVQVRLDAALSAWQERGLPVGAVVIEKDGAVRIEAPVDKPPESAEDARKPQPWI